MEKVHGGGGGGEEKKGWTVVGVGGGMVSAWVTWVGEEKVGVRTEMWADKMEVCTDENAVGRPQQADRTVEFSEDRLLMGGLQAPEALERSAVAQRSFAASTAVPGFGWRVAWRVGL